MASSGHLVVGVVAKRDVRAAVDRPDHEERRRLHKRDGVAHELVHRAAERAGRGRVAARGLDDRLHVGEWPGEGRSGGEWWLVVEGSGGASLGGTRSSGTRRAARGGIDTLSTAATKGASKKEEVRALATSAAMSAGVTGGGAPFFCCQRRIPRLRRSTRALRIVDSPCRSAAELAGGGGGGDGGRNVGGSDDGGSGSGGVGYYVVA